MATTPLMEINTNSPSKNAGGKKRKRLSVERIYTKKTQLEHILLRPDTYIGSVEPNKQNMFVYDDILEAIVNREITYVPGLFKIFDEILVNAADNKQRDPAMSTIKIEINPEKNFISVWNDGRGIPIEMHKEHQVYVPTMIFGQLLTSSNYNDDEKKVTGGRNGYGAKLCNIFSKKFSVETACLENKKRFKQVWTNNMGKAAEPVIKEFTSNKEYTCITFQPDLEKFKMETLDRDTVALLTRRAYDIAASVRGVSVILNGKKLKVKTFKDYVQLCLKGATKDKEEDDEEEKKPTVVHEVVNNRWEVCVTVSDKGFQQASFVNSIATTKGGTHVNYVTDQIVDKLMTVIKKKNKGGLAIKPFQIKSHLWVFINCLIENPAFDSQTKENMTLRAKDFGSKCELSDKFIKAVQNSGVMENVMNWMRFKEKAQLNKKCSGSKHSKIRGIPKLDDANDAGGKNSRHCTLILTEGDSAKTLAISGLSIVGRDRYGVFPLRGKLLNVREASHKQILDNAEINNIIKITGLQYNKKYKSEDDLKSLRYGHLMIMTDQDQDGSHIKGLVINFIHSNWPGLLKLGFVEQFITPIVKVSKGKEEHSFYSIPEYEEWKAGNANHKSWKVKYYKGLGTSTPKEAKEYFSDMERHKINFKYEGPHDDEAIVMAFSKKKIQERKDWLTRGLEERKWRREQGLSELYLYEKDTKRVSYCDFVNKELILFSNTDNERSIPSLVDGLKPGQRKVMFTCFKRNDKREVKVAQLAGSIAELSAYHHGEASLMGTIINLAENFVGSNNINLLQPVGQFGTRLHGGKDAASPRYIFTMLSTVSKMLFPPSDEPNLKFLNEDNQRIEPEWYCPIIPTILVNGAEGIGTGYSTKVPNYDPRAIAENIRKMMNGEEPEEMLPWYKNFIGTITKVDDTKYSVTGNIEVIDDTTLEITELPIGTWTQSYKESVLEPMLHGTDKVPPCITDYKEYHTETRVRFVITMAENKMREAEQVGLHKKFKLEATINTSNMVLFDAMGCLKKYDTTREILKEFFTLRMERYIMRKAYMEGMLTAESGKLNSQARFILEKIEGTIVIENKPKRDLITMLVQRGYPSDPVKAWKDSQDTTLGVDDSDDDTMSTVSSTASGAGGPDFNYLLNMSMWSLSQEKKDELLKQRDQKAAELEDLRKKSPKDLWNEDLDIFLAELEAVEQIEREDEMAMGKSKSGRALKSKPIKTAAAKSSKAPKPKQAPKPESKAAASTEVPPEEEPRQLTLIERLALKRTESTSSASSSVSEAIAPKKQSNLLSLATKNGKTKKGKKGSKGSDDDDDDAFAVDFSDSDDSFGVPVVKRTLAARAKAPSKFNFSDDEDEDDSFKSKEDDGSDDDNDQDFAVTKVVKKPTPPVDSSSDVVATRDLIEKLSPVKASKKTATNKPAVLDSDEESSSSSGILVIEGKSSPPKPAAGKTKKAPAKKAPAKSKKGSMPDPKQTTLFASMGKTSKEAQSLSDSDDELGSLLEKQKVSPKKKSSPKKKGKAPSSKSADSDEAQPGKKKAAPRKRPAKGVTAASRDGDSDSDASVEVVSKKKTTKAVKKAVNKSPPKRKKMASDSEESADEVVPIARTQRTRGAKPTAKYSFSDSEESEEDAGNDTRAWKASDSDSDFD
ncbi:DNA topoisomerase 2-alpha isoform X2 [Nematostella vectensis]|uniref:DNA topoisomerase 2-alpha isoform X2 n=1 Tax=Nematostella vectensis TaxID=45351 RepID=UPI0020776763|nr:DNA topoisomerase 2-alpha isoform X2 [Nematostella vectensis]